MLDAWQSFVAEKLYPINFGFVKFNFGSSSAWLFIEMLNFDISYYDSAFLSSILALAWLFVGHLNFFIRYYVNYALLCSILAYIFIILIYC
jgi:hypothetical protein